MTREAKIGLLVALAFLLVIGILLSDHVTTATREPGAPLTSVEDNIRGSMTAPGAEAPPVLPTPPQTVVVAPAPPAEPYTYPPQPTGVVGVVGVVGGPAQVAVVTVPPVDPWTPETPAGVVQTAVAPLALANDALTRTARDAGEPLVPAGHTVSAVAPVQPKLAGVNEYVAQPGDVLSKIVAKTLGRWTPENKEVFLKLNPKLRNDPDMIVVGETYIIPANAASVTALRDSPAAKPAAAKSAKGRTYTVKPGDTLYRIAARVCGDAGKQDEILKLNADQIDDPHQIGVGMTLKIPA